MRISVAFPPIPETPAHIELAEQLGYEILRMEDVTLGVNQVRASTYSANKKPTLRS